MVVNVTEIIDQSRLNSFHLRVIGLCALLLFFDGFDLQVISYAAPAIAQALGITRPMLGPVFSAGLAGLTAGALLFGLLGDRWGRKRVFILCGVVFGLASFGTATATSLGALLAWRLLAGFGLGGATPISITIATDYCPQRVRAALTMVMYCGFTIGGVAGGWVTAKLVPFGWQTVFYVGGIVPILLAPLLYATLPESVEYLVLKRGDPARVCRVLARLRPGFVPPDNASYVLTTHDPAGFQVKALFTEGRAVRSILLWMIFFVSLVGLFFYATWLPTLLHGNGLSGERIVGVTAALQGGGLIGSLILARVMVSVRPFRVITAGFILAAASMLVVSRIGPDYVLLVAMNLLVGILLVGTQNALNASSAQLYPPGIRATGVGWAIGVGRIGGALGPSIAGLLLALHVTPSGLIGLAAMPPLLAAAIAFVISRVVARAPEHAGSLAGAAAVR